MATETITGEDNNGMQEQGKWLSVYVMWILLYP